MNSGATAPEYGTISTGAYSIAQISRSGLGNTSHSGSSNTAYNFGTPIQVTPTASTDGNYMSFVAAFGTLTEGDFYTLKIKDGTAVIYKDRVFCTDQTVNQTNNDYYSVNSGEYTTENSFDNDYIIL